MASHSDEPRNAPLPADYHLDSDETHDDANVRETPLPWSTIATLMCMRLSEPINFVFILPFVYRMIEDFGVAKSAKDIAFYAGVLTASFSICQAMTVMYWGRLSDRIGRRPVLLMGLTGNFITVILFGVSKSFTWALAARSLNGLLNGNMAVAKSILAEITDDTNRTRAMALLPLFWNLGLAMGSAVGGLFAHPAEQYPSLFGDSWVFREFPYLLPCLIGSSVTLFGRIVCAFKFEETLASKIAKPRHDARDLASETTPLIQQQQQQATTGANAAVKSDGRRSVRELLTPTVVTVMVTNVFLCLSIAMDNQIYPIFAATGVEDGGLGFDTRSIGISLSTSGVVVLYLQLVAYPRWEKKYGSLYCYQSGQRALIPFYLLLPFLSNLAVRLDKAIENTQGTPDVSFEYMLLWVLLTILLLIRVTGSVLVFTSVNLLTANLAPTTNDLGFMNGAQQLAMSGARVVGPLAAGCIWSWSLKHDYPYPFNSHLVWVVCVLLTAISQYMSFSIPESVNKFAAAKGAKHGDGDGNGNGNGDGDLE